jgi:hypothetical protein
MRTAATGLSSIHERLSLCHPGRTAPTTVGAGAGHWRAACDGNAPAGVGEGCAPFSRHVVSTKGMSGQGRRGLGSRAGRVGAATCPRPPQRCTGDGSTLRRWPATHPPGARQGGTAGDSRARLAPPVSHGTLGRNTHVLPHRRQTRQAPAGGQAGAKRPRALGPGCPLPGSAPRRGPGGPPAPTVTTHRPAGPVQPHASSRGTGASLRAGRQPSAWWGGGMAPAATAAGQARGDAAGCPVGWQGEGPVGGHPACTRHAVRGRPGPLSRGPKSHGRSARSTRAAPAPGVLATSRRDTSARDACCRPGPPHASRPDESRRTSGGNGRPAWRGSTPSHRPSGAAARRPGRCPRRATPAAAAGCLNQARRTTGR